MKRQAEPTQPNGQRADARSNRARILEAADAVFGAGGEEVSTEEVARRAGVGIATVFRHFETKKALLEAVLERRSARLFEQASGVLETADPAQAFFDFFAQVVAGAASKTALVNAFQTAGGEQGKLAESRRQLRHVVAQLLNRAQQAGAVRGDIGLPEAYALLSGVAQTASQLDADTQRKTLQVIFDGLKKGANHPC